MVLRNLLDILSLRQRQPATWDRHTAMRMDVIYHLGKADGDSEMYAVGGSSGG
jgi:hypothetical protein